jgi:hypothetical protein
VSRQVNELALSLLEEPVLIAVLLVFMVYARSQMIVVAKFDYAATILDKAFVRV